MARISKTRDMQTIDMTESLRRNGVIIQDKTIMLPRLGPGIKLWGMIDYLVGELKYIVEWRRIR